MRRCITAILLGCWLWCVPAYTESPLQVTVRPEMQIWHRGAQVSVLIRVEKAPQNRLLRVEVEGPDAVNWEEELNGESARRLRQRFLGKVRPLPPGKYRITARVTRNDDTSIVSTAEFRLLGPGESPFDEEK